eukprot:1900682-Amphidinium_carterae.1
MERGQTLKPFIQSAGGVDGSKSSSLFGQMRAQRYASNEKCSYNNSPWIIRLHMDSMASSFYSLFVD